jgi:AcrR family transcriptional regulator
MMLDAALESFATFGYEGTSVRDLCRQLGVSHNLIHQRFGSKDELWIAAIDHGFGAMTLAMMQAVSALDEGDDLDRLRAVLISFVEVTAVSPALVRVISQEGVTMTSRLRYIHEHHIGRAMDLLSVMLGRLETAGRIRPISPMVLYFLAANGTAGPFTLPALASCFPDSSNPQRPDDVQRYAASVVDLLLEGFVVGEAR